MLDAIMGLSDGEIKAEYCGHPISLVTSALECNKLYIDGKIAEEKWNFLPTSKTIPQLRGPVQDENGITHIVEVYCAGLFFKISICVDGKRIGGE